MKVLNLISRFRLLSLPVLLLIFPVAYGEVHPEVQAALDWQFPEQPCKMKKAKRSVDVTTQQRLVKKAAKKFRKCFKGYEKDLKAEEDKLMSVASHGLTQAQAEVIGGHIAKIRWVLKNGASAVDQAQNAGGPNSEVSEHDFMDPNR